MGTMIAPADQEAVQARTDPSLHLRVVSPFPEYAVPRVWTWIQEFRSRVSDDYGAQTLEEYMVHWQNCTQKSWGVWRGEELGGIVNVVPMNPVCVTSHCFFKKSFWGHETTLPALSSVYQEVFETGVTKVLSFVFADNAQLIGLARKLGARKEGILRQQTMRAGRPMDMVAIGLLKEDFNSFHV